MTPILTPAYHWSPRARRKQIVRLGLVPGKRPTVGSISTVTDGKPMICLGTDPLWAWRLSAAMRYAPRGEWDLWQVDLAREDAVYVMPHWGPHVVEVRVANRVPKSRVHWLAERSVS